MVTEDIAVLTAEALVEVDMVAALTEAWVEVDTVAALTEAASVDMVAVHLVVDLVVATDVHMALENDEITHIYMSSYKYTTLSLALYHSSFYITYHKIYLTLNTNFKILRNP